MPAPLDPIPIKNASAEAIPSFGVVEPTGTITDGALEVDQPTATGNRNVLVNGPAMIPVGGTGQAFAFPRVVVAYDPAEGAPAAGDEWGAVAGSWLLGLNAGGFLIIGGAGGGAVNAVRYGATSETGGGGGGTTEREIRHGVLTEASGLATIQPRVLSGGLWANDGSTLTDAGLAVEVDGSAIVAKPTANVLYFDDPEGAGVYAYFPLQYADKVSSTYYPGLVSTGAQTWTGAKTLESASFTISSGSLVVTGGNATISGTTTTGRLLCSTDARVATLAGAKHGYVLWVDNTSPNSYAAIENTSSLGGSYALHAISRTGAGGAGGVKVAANIFSTVGIQIYTGAEGAPTNVAYLIPASGASGSTGLKVTASTLANAYVESGFFQADGSPGITATKTWTDGSGDSHSVEIKGGIIVDWTITPP